MRVLLKTFQPKPAGPAGKTKCRTQDTQESSRNPPRRATSSQKLMSVQGSDFDGLAVAGLATAPVSGAAVPDTGSGAALGVETGASDGLVGPALREHFLAPPPVAGESDWRVAQEPQSVQAWPRVGRVGEVIGSQWTSPLAGLMARIRPPGK